MFIIKYISGPSNEIALAKSILVPLGITAAASVIDAGIEKKIHGSGTITLITSNKKNERHNESCASS